MPMSVGAMKRDYCAYYPIPCLKEAIMSNQPNISLEEALALLKQKDEELAQARAKAKAEEENAKAKAEEAKEARRVAKEAKAHAKALEKSRPAGVLVKMAEAIIALSKEAMNGKLAPYGGSDAEALGKRTALCISKGFTKATLFTALLAALGKDEAHPDAPLHRATIDAQMGKRINERLAQMGVQMASGRGEGQKELRYMAFAITKG